MPADLHDELGAADARGYRFIAISIADSGVGMPEEVRERVFEPFFTTKEAGRGTGLGLSTVYGFVKQSKGVVAIDSTLGKGTTLTLYLPQAEAANAPAADEAAESEELKSGLRVMLVEDDPEVLKVVRTFLQALGCVVTVAASAEEALPLLQGGAAPDLLLSDIALGPGMRGTQLAAEVQQRLPDIAVLLMSGYSSDLLEADRESPPSWELLRKPYSRSELARAMVRVLANREGG